MTVRSRIYLSYSSIFIWILIKSRQKFWGIKFMLENLDLFFIRHGKLDLPYKRHEDMPYEILMGLSTGKLDPGIIDGSTNLFIKNSSTIPLGKINLIYYNNSNECSRRSEETAKLIAKVIKNNYQKDAEVVGNPDLR